jgi:hypothetical protein
MRIELPQACRRLWPLKIFSSRLFNGPRRIAFGTKFLEDAEATLTTVRLLTLRSPLGTDE